jgi:hypothetical protein
LNLFFILIIFNLCLGLNPGVNGLPLRGWPLTVSSIPDLICSGDLIKNLAGCSQCRLLLNIQGLEQIRPSLGAQVQRPLLHGPSQFQLLPQQQQQQLLAQVQAQGNLAASPMYGDMDPRKFRGLPRGALNSKDGQPNVNDGSIGSPMHSTSSKVGLSSLN